MRTDSEAEYVDYVTARLPALHRAAFLLCGGDAARADDVVQSTITRLYQRWKQASRADNLHAYVHRMLVHTFVDEQRRAWSRVRLLPWVGSDGPAGGEPQAAVDERDVLVAALRTLPPRQRAVLVMRFLLDRPIEEVAEALGCSEGTVKSQTSRGLSVLRDLLAVKK
jgi:RNA polymerase sigma-70 factor (sigma-E family)